MRQRGILRVGILVVLLPALAWCWTRTMDFEEGNVGDRVMMHTSGATYSDDQAFDGLQSGLTTIDAGEEGFGKWGGIMYHPTILGEGDEMWARVATFWPSSSTYNANPRLKFLRVKTPNGYDDWYINKAGSNPPFQFIYEGEQKWTQFGAASDAIVKGKWEVYEMYLKFHHLAVDSGGEARVRMWKDGRLIADITERKTLKAADTDVLATYIFTYWNGTAPANTSCYMDGIVITNETPAMRDAKGNPMIGPKPVSRIEVSHVHAAISEGDPMSAVGFDVAGRRIGRSRGIRFGKTVAGTARTGIRFFENQGACE